MSRLTNLSVNFLSLVRNPATGKKLTLKSSDKNEIVKTFELKKTNDERMVAYGIVYPVDQEDGHGDIADEVTVRGAAYEFMREARLKNIDTEHSFSSEHAYVCESWLVRKNDALFPDEPEGSWAVGIQVGDPDIWADLKKGNLTGISLAGLAQATDDEPAPRYTEKSDPEEAGIIARLARLLKGETTPKDGADDMTEEDTKALIKAELPGALVEAFASDDVRTALKSALPASTPTTEKPLTKSETERLIGDAIAKALAKGETEEGANAVAKSEESFA